jgi:uncharacterized BrkB/YihY/UPF0761 family membrane protein
MIEPSQFWLWGNVLFLACVAGWLLYYFGRETREQKEDACVLGVTLTIVYMVFFMSAVTWMVARKKILGF